MGEGYQNGRLLCFVKIMVTSLTVLRLQTKQTIDKLQTLVSTDGRFRNMREALHRCDPPCIPYLGMYLTG